MQKKELFRFLRQEIKPMDWLIIVLAVLLMGFKIDYGNLSTIDIVYFVTFGLWLIMFAVRLYFLSRGRRL